MVARGLMVWVTSSMNTVGDRRITIFDIGIVSTLPLSSFQFRVNSSGAATLSHGTGPAEGEQILHSQTPSVQAIKGG